MSNNRYPFIYDPHDEFNPAHCGKLYCPDCDRYIDVADYDDHECENEENDDD